MVIDPLYRDIDYRAIIPEQYQVTQRFLAPMLPVGTKVKKKSTTYFAVHVPADELNLCAMVPSWSSLVRKKYSFPSSPTPLSASPSSARVYQQGIYFCEIFN